MSKPAKKSAVAAPSGAAPGGVGGVHSTVVHPLVLLAVVDHYARVAEGTTRRVMGVLLGHVTADGEWRRRCVLGGVAHGKSGRSVRRDQLLCA
jgi:hypothetical protein